MIEHGLAQPVLVLKERLLFKALKDKKINKSGLSFYKPNC